MLYIPWHPDPLYFGSCSWPLCVQLNAHFVLGLLQRLDPPPPPDPSAFIPMFTSQHQTPTTRNCTHWALALDSRLRNDCLPSVCWNNTFFFLEMTHYSYLLGQSWERKVACDPCLDQVDEALHPPSQPTLDKPVNAHAQISHVHQVYYKSLSLLLK